MPPQLPPLDEREFDEPGILLGLPGGTLNTDSILWYFGNSPFYDRMCSNQALNDYIHRLPNALEIFNSRARYEAELRRLFPVGTQFVVVSEPQGPGQPWVIQRQRLWDDTDGKRHMEVEGTFYTVGTKILMAPSLLDVLQLKLLSVSTQLQDFFEMSQKLSHFSPATGHTYLPPSYELPKAAATASRIGSRIGSPALSATEPDAATAQSLDPEATTTEFSDSLFLHSFSLTNRFGHEYMDENPLQGEPGSFVFANTSAHVDARNKAQQQQREAAQAATHATNLKIEPQSTVPTPKATPTPTTQEAAIRKASTTSIPKPGKEKRRKSKALTSPTTPAAP